AGDVERPVGPDEVLDRPEPAVRREDEVFLEARGEGRAIRLQPADPHGVGPQVGVDHGLVETRGEESPLVDHEPAGQGAAEEAVVADWVEVAEGIGVMERAMLAEPLDVIGPLDVVAERLGGVAAGEEPALGVEIDPPGVAAALGEELELLRDRMVSPDALLELDAADLRRDGAA